MKLKYIMLILVILIMINVSSAYSSSGVKRAGSDWWGFDSNLFGYTIYNGTFNGSFIGSSYTTSQGRHLENGGCDASYCIKLNGTIWEAINGNSGIIESSNTNATIVSQYAINNAYSGNILSMGNITLNGGLTFLSGITYEHYGNVYTDGTMFTIGSSATNPSNGRISVVGTITGPNTTDSSIVKQISGGGWDLKVSYARLFGRGWEFAPVAQGSTKWYAGNRFELDAQVLTNVWYIPTEPANVMIEGNILDTAGNSHTLAVDGIPILFEGGSFNKLNGFGHNYGNITLPDIKDVNSRGRNIFIVHYLANPVYYNLSSTSVLVSPYFVAAPILYAGKITDNTTIISPGAIIFRTTNNVSYIESRNVQSSYPISYTNVLQNRMFLNDGNGNIVFERFDGIDLMVINTTTGHITIGSATNNVTIENDGLIVINGQANFGKRAGATVRQSGDEYFDSDTLLEMLYNGSAWNPYMTLNKFIAGVGVSLTKNATSGELTINATSILPQCPSTPTNGSMCLNYTTGAQNNYFNGNWVYTNGTII